MKNMGKLDVSSIICEFNPLHFGHKKIIEYAASLGGPVVCIMSGNFVQRGDLAIIDKWSRCRIALQSGADLVIELPLPWAMSTAERFALGSVATLNGLGLPGSLVFGSEAGDTEKLKTISEFLLSEDFSALLPGYLSDGSSFASARSRLVADRLGEEYANIIRSPNNILGIEYIKALIVTGSPLSAASMQRIGAGHDQPSLKGELLSAGEVRRQMLSGNPNYFSSLLGKLPENTLAAIEALEAQGLCPVTTRSLETSILYKLRTMTAEDFEALPDISEGLGHKMYAAARTAISLDEFHSLVKSKRYSHARIRRLTLSAFLGLDSSLPATPKYIRVLGMTAAGEAILKSAKYSLPLCIRPADFLKHGVERLYELEARADDVYALAYPKPQVCGRDYSTGLIKI